MYKFTNKVILGVIGFSLFNSLTFAIEPEFKNSLMKIELNKANENAYIVNLYTKTNFIEPIKIIKKSDLNYYILLPETKNESSRISGYGNEIRNISTNVYPYAGQDVKNGYIKINIDTTKPLEFKVNIRKFEIEKKALNESVVASSQVAEITKKEVETSSQKKNSSSITKKVQLKPKKITEEEGLKTSENNTLKIEDVIRQEIERVREDSLKDQQEVVFQEYEQETAQILAEENKNEFFPTNEELNELKQIVGEKVEQKQNNSCDLKRKIANQLAQYGISLKEFAFMLLALFFSLLFVLKVLTKKAPQVGLKNKIDLIDKETKPSFKLRQKDEVKNDGQYFVFDKNVKQIGFCDPATDAVGKNYELSTYEPELKNKYERNENFSNKNDIGEYDIIQKILKEDTFIDLPAEVSPIKKIEAKKTVYQEEKKEQQVKKISAEKKESKKPEIAEPQVLSSVEIAPERGFMCVSYNNNINLLGYIFDDVFPLYNFKVQKLENYDIKFRLSEKDEKYVRFIVKIADTKMLIRVSKSQMIMEVLL